MTIRKPFIILAGTLFFIGCSNPSAIIDTPQEKSPTITQEENAKPIENTPTTISGEVAFASDYLGSYEIIDEEYGTRVTVVVDDENRTITSNALPNHETGIFPNEGNPNTISTQEKTWVLPVNPVYTGAAQWAREAGVAINGVKFEPETNERISCTSGETYRIEAVQDMVNLGLDTNNAHVQPTGEYHYHGVSDNVVAEADAGNDLVHIGFANDGFLILYSKSGAYKPSYKLKTELRSGESCTYTTRNKTLSINIDGTTPDGTYVSDWEFVDGHGDLDQCDGIYINDQYVYIASKDYPYIGRCLNGEVKNTNGGRPSGPPPTGAPGGQNRPDPRSPR